MFHKTQKQVNPAEIDRIARQCASKARHMSKRCFIVLPVRERLFKEHLSLPRGAARLVISPLSPGEVTLLKAQAGPSRAESLARMPQHLLAPFITEPCLEAVAGI